MHFIGMCLLHVLVLDLTELHCSVLSYSAAIISAIIYSCLMCGKSYNQDYKQREYFHDRLNHDAEQQIFTSEKPEPKQFGYFD